MPTLLVCSGSDEQEALVDMADVVVAGPDGVMDPACASSSTTSGTRAA